MKEVKAQLNYLNITPRKVRLVGNTLKGLTVSEAEAQLILRPQRASGKLLKLLRSALSNAKNNRQMNAEQLIVSQVVVNPAPSLKRSLPRAQGRATPILKRMSHVTIILKEAPKPIVQKFSIIVSKKDKKAKGEKPKQPLKEVKEKAPKPAKKEKGPEAEKQIDKKQKKTRTPGVLRRFFQRRSGM